MVKENDDFDEEEGNCLIYNFKNLLAACSRSSGKRNKFDGLLHSIDRHHHHHNYHH
jgi:hypothetical protein